MNLSFPNIAAYFGGQFRQCGCPLHMEISTMKKKHFGDEYLFEFIWNNCDHEGLWDGDAVTVAEEFGVSEDEAYATLSELCDRGLMEKLPGKYAVTRWTERHDPGEEELLC